MSEWIVYGIDCSWWDSIEKASALILTSGEAVPRCPHCGSFLLRVEEDQWWKAVEQHEREVPYPGYRTMIEWARGRCYPSNRHMREAYEESSQLRGNYHA